MIRPRLILSDRRTGEVTFEGRPVTSRRPCEVCGHPKHKPQGWCLRDDERGLIVCPHSVTGIKEIGDAGWLHRIDGAPVATTIDWQAKRDERRPEIDAEALHRRFVEAIGDAQVDSLADSLGVSISALGAMGVGYCHRSAAFTFPMRRRPLNSITGIRLRHGGEKWAVTGSREGLFYDPSRYGAGAFTIFDEGPTSAAALWDLGFEAVGRPSARSGDDYAEEYAHGRPVVIVAQPDEPDKLGRRAGIDGAAKLADRLRQCCPSVKVIRPRRGKDGRAWINAGATSAEVAAVIRNTPEWAMVRRTA